MNGTKGKKSVGVAFAAIAHRNMLSANAVDGARLALPKNIIKYLQSREVMVSCAKRDS